MTGVVEIKTEIQPPVVLLNWICVKEMGQANTDSENDDPNEDEARDRRRLSQQGP